MRSLTPDILIHAQRVMDMLDSAMGLLGPNHELLTEILSDAGVRHVKFGVNASYIPYMGKALAPALSDVLGSQWTGEVAQAWEIVMNEFASDLMKAITKAEQAGKEGNVAITMSSGASSRSLGTNATLSSSFSSKPEVEEVR
jgi:hypothetical protein